MGLNKRHKGQRGAAAVEFALVLPLLALVLFGMIEFGLLFYNQQVLINASREGARAGTTRLVDAATIPQVVSTYCQGRLVTFASTPQAVQTSVAGGGAYPNSLSVTVQYVYDFLAPQILGLGMKKTLAAQTAMTMERE